MVLIGIYILKAACKGIEDDECFSVEAEGMKICLSSARKLREYIEKNSSEEKVIEFTEWLLAQLQTIVRKATKASLDQVVLWSHFHHFRCSDGFKEKWKTFLSYSALTDSSIFYQTLTTRILDYIILDSFPIPTKTPFPDSSVNNLTYEEENAIRYVGGYIIKTLKKQNCDTIDVALNDLVDEDGSGEADESREWVGSVDRGGLIYISDPAFALCSIEYALRRELNVQAAHTMDDNYRKKMKESIESDEDVQFNWTMVSVEMDDEVSEKFLDLIIDEWITIRGFSFASSVMEMYKMETKQGTQKAKRLRHDVTQK